MEKTLVSSLGWLEKAQEITETLATPHRLFDVDSVRQDCGENDPFVAMQLIFVEHANTGVRSALERFYCTVISEGFDLTGPHFMVDLIEGLSDLIAVNFQPQAVSDSDESAHSAEAGGES